MTNSGKAHAWRPSPSPLAPFLSRSAGEEGGGSILTFPTAPFHSLTAGVEGGGSILTFPAALSAPSRREWKGEESAEQGRY